MSTFSSDSALVKEFQEFSKRASELQGQYRLLVTQLIPSNEVETNSLQNVSQELSLLPEDNIVYHSHGKVFLKSSVPKTRTMISESEESNKRNLSILLEKKKHLEQLLKEAEEQQKIYLSKLKPTAASEQ